MKTPIQELLKYESDLSHMFDSDQRIAMAVLTYIRDNRQELLDKEKEIIQRAYKQGVLDEYGDTLDLDTITDAEEYFDRTFNIKEK